MVSSSITSPSQLKGKTLATPQLGNTQDVALRTWLKKQGLTFPGPNGGSGEVTILPQDNATTLTSFEAGTIAGAWVPEPWATRMVSEGHGHVLVNEKTQWPKGQFSTTVLVVSTDFLAAHPSVVDGLLKGQLATTASSTPSPAKAQADANTALATLTGKALKARELATAWSDMTFTNDPIASSIPTDVAHAKAAGLPASQHQRDLRPRAASTRSWSSQGKAKRDDMTALATGTAAAGRHRAPSVPSPGCPSGTATGAGGGDRPAGRDPRAWPPASSSAWWVHPGAGRPPCSTSWPGWTDPTLGSVEVTVPGRVAAGERPTARAKTEPAGPGGTARHRHALPGLGPLPLAHRGGQRRAPAPPPRRGQGRAPGESPPNCSNASTWRASGPSDPTSSPGACGNGPRWPGPWPRTPACC